MPLKKGEPEIMSHLLQIIMQVFGFFFEKKAPEISNIRPTHMFQDLVRYFFPDF